MKKDKSEAKTTKIKRVPKTKKPIKEQGKFELIGPNWIEGTLHFSRLDLQQYELIQERVQSSYKDIQLKRVEIEETRRMLSERIVKLNNDLQSLLVHSKNKEEELRILQSQIENAYKIKTTQLSYDDITGKIFVDNNPVLSENFKG